MPKGAFVSYPLNSVDLCQYGRVVVRYDSVNKRETYGHIIGFNRNSRRELLITVRWEGNKEEDINPANVEFIGRDVE